MPQSTFRMLVPAVTVWKVVVKVMWKTQLCILKSACVIIRVKLKTQDHESVADRRCLKSPPTCSVMISLVFDSYPSSLLYDLYILMVWTTLLCFAAVEFSSKCNQTELIQKTAQYSLGLFFLRVQLSVNSLYHLSTNVLSIPSRIGKNVRMQWYICSNVIYNKQSEHFNINGKDRNNMYLM